MRRWTAHATNKNHQVDRHSVTFILSIPCWPRSKVGPAQLRSLFRMLLLHGNLATWGKQWVLSSHGWVDLHQWTSLLRIMPLLLLLLKMGKKRNSAATDWVLVSVENQHIRNLCISGFPAKQLGTCSRLPLRGPTLIDWPVSLLNVFDGDQTYMWCWYTIADYWCIPYHWSLSHCWWSLSHIKHCYYCW